MLRNPPTLSFRAKRGISLWSGNNVRFLASLGMTTIAKVFVTRC